MIQPSLECWVVENTHKILIHKDPQHVLRIHAAHRAQDAGYEMVRRSVACWLIDAWNLSGRRRGKANAQTSRRRLRWSRVRKTFPSIIYSWNINHPKVIYFETTLNSKSCSNENPLSSWLELSWGLCSGLLSPHTGTHHSLQHQWLQSQREWVGSGWRAGPGSGNVTQMDLHG